MLVPTKEGSHTVNVTIARLVRDAFRNNYQVQCNLGLVLEIENQVHILQTWRLVTFQWTIPWEL